MSAARNDAPLRLAAGEGLDPDLEGGHPARAEKREQVVKIVEYSHYPRLSRDQRRNVGFTRNESRSGMCIAASEREDAGILLRVAIRTVDGGATFDALARVVWCDARPDGRHWLGLALMERSGRRMRSVRRRGEDGEISQRS